MTLQLISYHSITIVWRTSATDQKILEARNSNYMVMTKSHCLIHMFLVVTNGNKSIGCIFDESARNQKSLQGGWTKGKLSCPSCCARVGGFDFVSGSTCSSPVYLVRSRVDLLDPNAAPLPLVLPKAREETGEGTGEIGEVPVC